MATTRSLNPLASLFTVLAALVRGSIHSPRDRIGTVVRADDDQRFTVYRETTVDPEPAGVDHDSGAVLAFRFRLRFMPASIRSIAVRIFEPLSIVTAPFIAGIPGFRTKLWLFDHGTGDYEGIYEWGDATVARRYATALRRLMDVLSVPGSVEYEIHEETSLGDYLAVRSPTGEEKRLQDFAAGN